MSQLLLPDNEARRGAEEKINNLAKDPTVVPALLAHVRSSVHENVRQLAAVLLRKKITGHWMKLGADVQESTKNVLLESIVKEPSSRVRRASADVVSIIAKHCVPSGQWPGLLPFLFECSQSSQEEHREVALILFSSLTETVGDMLRPQFVTLHAIFVNGLRDKDSSRVRVAALKAVGSLLDWIQTEQEVAVEIISCLARFKPKTLVRHKLVLPILSVMCPVITEPEGRDEEDEISAHRFAAQLVDTLAVNLPKKHVYPPLLEFVKMNAHSQAANNREAASMVLGIIAEGCNEVMRQGLDELMPLALGGLRDPEPLVRGAASFAIGQFAEHLQPEILERYAEFLPAVFTVLGDAEPGVREKVYYALDAFLEQLGEELLPYLEPLMNRLMEALRVEKRVFQGLCLSAMGSLAAAAGSAFVPYVETVLSVLKEFMMLEQPDDLHVRSRATELVGIIGVAVGRSVIEPVLPGFMELALKGFALDAEVLREYGHGFFGNVAEILEADFAQYLPHVMPQAFASCYLDDGSLVDVEGSDNEEEGDMDNGAVDLVSSDEDHEGDDTKVRNLSIRTGVLDEKAAATQALGLFALHTKEAFRPYLEETLAVLKKNSGYFHEDVRVQAIIALQHLLTATQAAFPTGSVVADGVTLPIAAEVKHVLDTVMEAYIRTLEEEDDKETVAQACLCIVPVIKSVGLAPVETYMKRLSDGILDIVKQKALCQWHGDSDAELEEEEDEEEEHDEVLMDAATDVLPAMASLMGASFEPVFREHFEPLTKFMRPSRPASDHTMVIACVAEVAKYIGPAIQPYIESVMPVAIKELAAEEAGNKRNAAFCIGKLCEHGGATALPYYQNVLGALHPIFQKEEEEPAVKDNACGAVARMIMASPSALPLAQVLPVFISGLPLKEDMEEAESSYGCLCNLIQAGCAEILPHIPQVVKVFGEVVTQADVPEQVKGGIGSTVKLLYNQYMEQMQPVLSSLPPEHAQALSDLVGRV
ncbi:hypothetical protein CBR_g3136 [Chara braunii]|uniref:Importin N-terminal domain-containing protein n=1 Tax=Chara braunii TaxID=69332 RepID=A0A388KEY1_CHABU|nr:hypothetical protein CBR_g3136 [Chara braunii]|eukprot:GBG68591.1 hypothetical protein CBR_g3136 [Chara braunii]